jgi:hypothetical protein
VTATALIAIYVRDWRAVFFAVPLAFVVHCARRLLAVHFPLGLKTVGEMVIYATDFGEHQESGYHWTRNEIELKVRMTLADCTGQSLDAIQPGTKFLRL